MKLYLIGEKHAPYGKEQCSYKADIIDQFRQENIPFDVFYAVTNLACLLKLLVDESNLYVQQNGREIHTNEQEMRVFLGINFIMSINKLPTITSYWECGQFTGSEDIRNVMAGSRFGDTLQNLDILDNTTDDKSDKGYKV